MPDAFAIAVLHATPADVIIDRDRVASACRAPYPGHRDGCPHGGKCHHYPVERLVRDYPEILLYVCRVDLVYLREQYGLAAGQRVNILWWQGASKKRLRERMVQDYQDGDLVLACGSGFKLAGKAWESAEACGVLLLDDGEKRGTLSRMGVEYERNPVNYATMVAMMGKAKKPTGQGRLL